jgi:hypothetical protein
MRCRACIGELGWRAPGDGAVGFNTNNFAKRVAKILSGSSHVGMITKRNE